MPARVRRTSSQLLLLQMKHSASVHQSQLVDGCKVLTESIAKCGFGDVRVDGTAAAQQLLKLRIRWGHPFEDKVACRQVATKGGDAIHRNLIAEQQVVQHREHHHGVEVAGATAEKGAIFAVLPSRSGRWMSEIDAQ